jgi:hypothetical protein
MENRNEVPEIYVDFCHERLTFARLPGPKLHIESTTLTAECSGKKYSDQDPEVREGFDLLDDTKEGAEIEHSNADPRTVCQKFMDSSGNSEPTRLSVSVNIKGRPVPGTATFVVRFAKGKLDKI